MALIALGVTGGIGAYKAVEVARGLQKRGHEVVAVMTHSATRFVGPVTFEAITRRRVITDQFEPGANADIEHIAIASGIDLLLVAPATANTIAKFANGLADDFLSALFTATRAPVLVAPAMNTNMFEHPAVVKNMETLIARGEFLEWADVFGNLYGTSRPDTERLQKSGQDVVLTIDVQGAQQVKSCGIDHTAIFVLPPSFEILERRLRGRSADSEADMQRRLATARAEVGRYVDYDYVVVNDELEGCVDRLRAIVLAERARLPCARVAAERIVETFHRKD